MEKLEIEITADTSKFKKNLNSAKDDIAGFKERAKSDTAIELSVKIAKLKADLQNVRKLMKEDIPRSVQIELSAKSELLKRDVTQAGRELTNFLRTGQKDVSVLGNMFSGIWSGLKWSLVWIWASIASAFTVDKFVKISDTFTNMQNSLRQIASGDELDILQKKILKLANDSRVPVDSLTNSFVRYDKVIRAMGGTQEETFIVMDSLSKSLTSTGRTAEETSSIMLQLSQAFASGKLQGDEFRSLSENMPQIMDILAKSMDVPRGSLKELSSDGKITAEVLKKALIEANTEINDSFGKSQITISQKLTQVKNDFLIAFWEFDKTYGFTQKLIEQIDFIASGLKILWTAFVESAKFINRWAQLWVAVVGELVLAFWTGFTLIGDSFGQLLFFLVNNLKIQGNNLVKISENVAFNIGQAFNDIPWTIAKALNSALNSVFSFFSKSLEKYNEFVDFIGQGQLKVNSKISGTGIESKNIWPKFRSLTEWTSGIDNSFNLAITKKGVDAMGRGLADIESKWKSLTGTVNENTKATKSNIDTSISKSGKSSVLWGGGGSSGARKELDARKKFLEEKAILDIQNVKNSTDTEIKKAEQILEINRKLKEDISLLDGKYYDVEAKRAEEFLKNEEKDLEDRKKLREKSYKDLSDSEKQQLDDVQKLGNAYADLKNKLAEVGKKGADDIKAINDEIEKLQKNLSDIQSKGQKDIATRGIEAQKELQAIKDKQALWEGITPEELQKRFDLEKEIALVNSSTTPEERAKALEESKKSVTQLLLDEIALNEEKAKQEIADAERRKVETEAQIALEQKAIKDKMDAIAIQITNETTIMLAEDVKRRKIESDFTAFFGEQIAQRKSVMDELIQKAQQASIAIKSAGISTMSGTATQASNTTANSIVQNITNNSNVDAESFLRAINQKLPTK